MCHINAKRGEAAHRSVSFKFLPSYSRSCKITPLSRACVSSYQCSRDTAVPAEGNGDLQSCNLCPCGEIEMMSHIVKSCHLTKLNGGISRLHSADEDAVSWLINYGS